LRNKFFGLGRLLIEGEDKLPKFTGNVNNLSKK
jgi:hypothetical protein